MPNLISTLYSDFGIMDILGHETGILACITKLTFIIRRYDSKKKKCPNCQSLKTVKNGSGDHGQRYLCKDCQKRFRLPDYVHQHQEKELWEEFVFLNKLFEN